MSYNQKWYTDAGNLRRIERGLMARLLERHSAELARAGITVPEAVSDDEFYRGLAAVFMRPEGIPANLHEALYFVHSLDNPQAEARIVDAVLEGRLDIALDGPLSTPDKVVLAWLADEEVVRDIHLQAGLDRTKSFSHYVPEAGRTVVMGDFAGAKAAMEAALCEVCGRRSRKDWVSLSFHQRGEESVLVVTHTEPFRRETKQEAGGTEPIFYWPLAQDLVVFNREYGDLRMNVTTKWQKEAYLEIIGQHLFGDARLFRDAPTYTLAPLRWRGRRALEATAYGIELIALVELQLRTGITDSHQMTHRAEDVFEVLEALGPIPMHHDIVSAKFKVWMPGNRSPRMVEIRAPFRSKYKHDPFAANIERWLRGQEFITSHVRRAA